MDKQLDIRGDRVGDVLLAEGKVTRGQLDEARQVQIQDHRDLSDILLTLGYIGKEDLARALARKLRLKYVEITENSVDPQAAAMLDRRILRKHGVVPLRVEEGHLVVATSSPSNFYMLEDLAMLSGYPIRPVVALQEDIERVLNRVFTIKQEVAEIFEGDGAGPTEVEPEIELGIEARPDEAPIIRLVTALLQRAVTEGASDIHVEPRPGAVVGYVPDTAPSRCLLADSVLRGPLRYGFHHVDRDRTRHAGGPRRPDSVSALLCKLILGQGVRNQPR